MRSHRSLSLFLVSVPWFNLSSAAEFRTEPRLKPVSLEVLRSDPPQQDTPTYIFTTGVKKHGVPQIFDSKGELIWHGLDTVRESATGFHVCDYLGESHLCFHDGDGEQIGWGLGKIRFLDSTYTQVGGDFGAIGGLPDPDRHELNTSPALNGGGLLQDVVQLRQMDLTAYEGPEDGWILENCFQEIDLRTHQEIFKWCVLDHLPIWDTAVSMTFTSNWTAGFGGSGTRDSPWDFFHINAIDKTDDGAYLISSRHLNSILKIAGPDNTYSAPPGTILWRLAGRSDDERSNFILDGFNFSRQHSVRFVNQQGDKTRLTLLNNAADGSMRTSNFSDGQLIELDLSTQIATLVKSYPHPDGNLSLSAGYMETLPNGNVFIGWGENASFTEFDTNGTVLLHGRLNDTDLFSQRIFKQAWIGRPTTKPKIIAYAAGCDFEENPLVIYASWNGATEVTHWKVYVRSLKRTPWIPIRTFAREGFETFINLSSPWTYKLGFARYVHVQALDAKGKVLSGVETRIWIPKSESGSAFNCDKLVCDVEYFDYPLEHSDVGSCKMAASYSVGVVFAYLFVIASIGLLSRPLVKIIRRNARRKARRKVEVDEMLLLHEYKDHT